MSELCSMEDPFDAFTEFVAPEVPRVGLFLCIHTIDPDGRHARSLSSGQVAPPISDHHASVEVDCEARCKIKDQARFRFSTPAIVFVVMCANRDLGERQHRAERVVDLADRSCTRRSSRDVGLIRYYEQRDACGDELLAGIFDAVA